MKPRSIIFIILAAVLIIAGVVTCIVSASIASSKNIELLSDTIDEKGNAVTTDDISGYGITNLSIDMDNVDVNIIGGSEKSYIEFVNINPAKYDYTVSGYKMTLKTINPYDVTALLKIRKNSSGFSGLRSYFFLNKYKDSSAAVNIYISEAVAISEMKIKVKNGNINLKNIDSDCLYELSANKGNVTLDKIDTLLDSKITVNKGDLNVSDSSLRKNEFKVNTGNATFADCERSHYYVTCESGIVYFDDKNQGAAVEGLIYPEEITQEEETDTDTETNAEEAPAENSEEDGISLPDEIKGEIVGGNMFVTSKTDE